MLYASGQLGLCAAHSSCWSKGRPGAESSEKSLLLRIVPIPMEMRQPERLPELSKAWGRLPPEVLSRLSPKGKDGVCSLETGEISHRGNPCKSHRHKRTGTPSWREKLRAKGRPDRRRPGSHVKKWGFILRIMKNDCMACNKLIRFAAEKAASGCGGVDSGLTRGKNLS